MMTLFGIRGWLLWGNRTDDDWSGEASSRVLTVAPPYDQSPIAPGVFMSSNGETT
jgi:hypothetical protein